MKPRVIRSWIDIDGNNCREVEQNGEKWNEKQIGMFETWLHTKRAGFFR